jgi:hypothetical protein
MEERKTSPATQVAGEGGECKIIFTSPPELQLDLGVGEEWWGGPLHSGPQKPNLNVINYICMTYIRL